MNEITDFQRLEAISDIRREEIERLRARIAELEAALMPFAAFNKDLRPDVKTRGACLEASDIRRAARALNKDTAHDREDDG